MYDICSSHIRRGFSVLLVQALRGMLEPWVAGRVTGTDSRAISFYTNSPNGVAGLQKTFFMMKHFFRFLCVMAMLCYSMSGFGVTNVNQNMTMWLGTGYTIIAPDCNNGTASIHKHYVWEYDAAYFSVEYLTPRHDYEYSQGDNVIKVNVLQPFQGTKTIKCITYSSTYTEPSFNSYNYNYNITCNPVNIVIYPTGTTMDVGESQNLQWQFNPQGSQYFAFALFSFSNPSVATVDLLGKITAKGPGTATITATNNYGTTATCQVTVNPLLASSISLSQTSMNLAVGATRTLTDTILPIVTSNKAVTWTSSNNNIATVDANGTVTAIKQGTANITATTADGTNLSADCLITVYPEQGMSGNTGDVNGDGIISIADVTALIDFLLSGNRAKEQQPQ